MSQKTPIFVPRGYALTLTTDAFSAGVYVRQSDPGVEPYNPTAIAASTTAVLGPFNEPRNYLVDIDGNAVDYSLAFSGIFTGADDSAYAPLASPTFTGTATLPIVIVAKANNAEASNLVTASGSAGVITTSSLSTGAGLTYAITWTNTAIAATSVIMLTWMGGTNTKNVIFKVVPGTGSATLTIYNTDLLAALDGTIKIGYLVV